NRIKILVIMKYSFFQIGLIAIGFGVVQVVFGQADHNREKTNVILIMADDMGYETLGAYGSAVYQTPNLDRMAENGVKFTNMFSQPLCTPSRVKIMTGKYNYRNYTYPPDQLHVSALLDPL